MFLFKDNPMLNFIFYDPNAGSQVSVYNWKGTANAPIIITYDDGDFLHVTWSTPPSPTSAYQPHGDHLFSRESPQGIRWMFMNLASATAGITTFTVTFAVVGGPTPTDVALGAAIVIWAWNNGNPKILIGTAIVAGTSAYVIAIPVSPTTQSDYISIQIASVTGGKILLRYLYSYTDTS